MTILAIMFYMIVCAVWVLALAIAFVVSIYWLKKLDNWFFYAQEEDQEESHPFEYNDADADFLSAGSIRRLVHKHYRVDGTPRD